MKNINNDAIENLGRRKALQGVAALTATMVAGAAVAATQEHDHHAMHHVASPVNDELVSTALHCIKTGDACLDHCIQLFKAGDTSVANCADKVNEMLAMCAALSKMASYDSAHLAKMAGVCMAVCKDCKAECEKHASKHVECKNCAESCEACISACLKVAA